MQLGGTGRGYFTPKALIALSLMTTSVLASEKVTVTENDKYKTVVINHIGNSEQLSKRISKLLNENFNNGWLFKSQSQNNNSPKRSVIFIFSKV